MQIVGFPMRQLIFQDLDKHSNFVKHTIIPDVHPDLIRQVQLIPDNDMIISSCANPNKSLVISDIKRLKKSYVFKNDKVGLLLFVFFPWKKVWGVQ